MNRSLKLSLLLALALGSSQAVALELGQIQVKSALGQPLVAEIPVTPESPADLRNLSAKLASDDDFLRAGITDGRPRVPLSFSVVNGAGGSKLIRITSTQAINDPFLDLLVEVDNASGKSLREYTILLDPPGTAATPPPASRPAARPSRRASAPASAPVSRPAPAPAAAANNGQLGPVQRGQTLSAIAAQVRPEGVDLNQMLLAFKQANPDAFYRDNINALKSGAVLRVPSADEARAVTIAAALAEVRRQNSDWRAGTVSAPTNVADTATRAGASSSPTTPASKPGDHLELLPSSAGKAASTGGGKASEVRRDLQRSQEALANLQQQSADLRSRLKDLEDINGKNQRLLSLKDSEIAELQQKLAEARKGSSAGGQSAPAPAAAPMTPAAKETKPATPPAAAAVPAPGKTSTAAAPAMAAAASTKAPAAATTAMTKPQASQPAAAKPATKPPVAKKPAPKQSPVAAEPWYMQTWAWAAGAGAVVLLLLLLLRGRGAKPSGKQSGSSLADRFGEVPPMGGESDDPDQDELLDQLAENPDDINLHLELVSLYYHRRDVEHFEAAAEAMYAHISDPQQSEWQDVAAMGEDLVPGHPLFAGVDTSVPEDERAPLAGFSLDDDDDMGHDEVHEPVEAVPPPAASGPSKISEYHFDFNLTPRHDAPRQPPPMPSPETELPDIADSFAHVQESEELSKAASEVPSWSPGDDAGFEPTEFSDDPIDTKLDLARAYLDMGDADGARAMLEEVLAEGTQVQRDTARRLLDGIA